MPQSKPYRKRNASVETYRAPWPNIRLTRDSAKATPPYGIQESRRGSRPQPFRARGKENSLGLRDVRIPRVPPPGLLARAGSSGCLGRDPGVDAARLATPVHRQTVERVDLVIARPGSGKGGIGIAQDRDVV